MKPAKSHHVVLVLWGAQTPGKRPGTKLACIEVAYPDELEVTFVRSFNRRGAPVYYNRARKVPYDAVAASWADWPTPYELRTARNSLTPIAMEGAR